MTCPFAVVQGSVFFSIPDGSGILYILHGISEPPKPEATITEEIKCKSHHTQTVSVHNWLPRPQRYLICKKHIHANEIDPNIILH